MCADKFFELKTKFPDDIQTLGFKNWHIQKEIGTSATKKNLPYLRLQKSYCQLTLKSYSVME